MVVRGCLAVVALAATMFLLLEAGCGSGPQKPAANLPAPATRPAGGIAERICKAALDWLDRAIGSGMVEKMVPAAEAVAERMIAGGMLYAAGNEGFCDELFYRAGGFPFTEIWQEQQPSRGDVVVIGQYRPNGDDFQWGLADAKARRETFGEALIVHFASHNWPAVKSLAARVAKGPPDKRLYLFDTGTPAGESMEAYCLGQLATTALVWAFHGEVISAATRKGKTLATYASDWEPDGPEWDGTVRGHHLHPTCKVPPIAAGKIGRQYLKICRKYIAAFGATQGGQVRLGAARMAKAMAKGGRVYILTNAHVHPRGSVIPAGLARMEMRGRERFWGWVRNDLREGDVLLWMGYLRYPREPVEQAVMLGAGAVTLSVDPGVNDEQRVHLLSCWEDFDTVIDLPKYPIRVLPSSGTVQIPQWYSIMAETLAAYKEARSASAGR